MNRNIIIALIIIVLIALVGIFAFTQVGGKVDTQINFITNTTLKNGDQIIFELKDSQGNVLENQIVEITFGNETYTVNTDSQGRGGLLLNDESVGSYNLNVSYAGDDEYNGCSASQTIVISEGTTENTDTSSDSVAQSSTNSDSSTPSSSSSSDSSSDLNYDSDLNVYYDSNGKIVGGQDDGESYEYIKNNPAQVDEDGNLV